MKEWDFYLFDLDGTIVDTKEMIYVCFNALMQKYYGRSLTKEDVFQYIGLPYREQLEKYTGPLTEEKFNILVDHHRTHQREIYHDYVIPCKGAIETIKELARRGKRLGIVTSRLRPSSSDYLEKFDIYQYFEFLVTPAETTKHKPYPEPIYKAMELMGEGATKENTVYIGDAVFDIQAGAAAGLETIYTDWEGKGFHYENSPKPNYLISDLEELLK